MFKKGDKVIIKDWSYAVLFDQSGKYTNYTIPNIVQQAEETLSDKWNDIVWTVRKNETGLESGGGGTRNTIILDAKRASGATTTIYTQSSFLEPVPEPESEGPFCIETPNESFSESVQKAAFRAGYRWRGISKVQHADAKWLCFQPKTKIITYSNSETSHYPLKTPRDAFGAEPLGITQRRFHTGGDPELSKHAQTLLRKLEIGFGGGVGRPVYLDSPYLTVHTDKEYVRMTHGENPDFGKDHPSYKHYPTDEAHEMSNQGLGGERKPLPERKPEKPLVAAKRLKPKSSRKPRRRKRRRPKHLSSRKRLPRPEGKRDWLDLRIQVKGEGPTKQIRLTSPKLNGKLDLSYFTNRTADRIKAEPWVALVNICTSRDERSERIRDWLGKHSDALTE